MIQVRVVKEPTSDHTWHVQTRSWWFGRWYSVHSCYGDAGAKERALAVAKELKNPIVVEVK